MEIIDELSTEEEREDFFKNNPPTLCKYRVWSNNDHKKVITQAELFFSSPSRFNDPYDCALPFKQHPENSDPLVIKEMIERTAPELFPGLASFELEEKCAHQLLLIQQDPLTWFEMNNGYRPDVMHKTFGVISLTPHADNYLMWSHYADSHKGFCVQFDTRKLVESIRGRYQKVNYTDDIPEFSIRDNRKGILIDKLLYTKSKIWDYEDEYRITGIHRSDKPVNFNPEAVTGIYFGCNMKVEDQIQIIEEAQKLNPKIKFHKMELDKVSFKVVPGNLPLL